MAEQEIVRGSLVRQKVEVIRGEVKDFKADTRNGRTSVEVVTTVEIDGEQHKVSRYIPLVDLELDPDQKQPSEDEVLQAEAVEEEEMAQRDAEVAQAATAKQ